MLPPIIPHELGSCPSYVGPGSSRQWVDAVAAANLFGRVCLYRVNEIAEMISFSFSTDLATQDQVMIEPITILYPVRTNSELHYFVKRNDGIRTNVSVYRLRPKA